MQGTPSKTGLITDACLNRPDAVRSDHPTHSVCAIGPAATDLTQGHFEATALGINSPWYKMHMSGGYILLLGCGFESLTFIHTCERLCELPFISEFVWDGYGWEAAGRVKTGDEEAIVPLLEVPGCSEGFGAVEEVML